MAEIIREVIAQRTGHEFEAPRPLVREIEPAEPFPIEALGPLQTAVEAIQAHTQAPVAICAQSVLGAVSLVTQAHADVVLPTGQARPTSLFLMTIAPTGERKSAVDKLALQAIYEREAELRISFDHETTAFKVTHDIWEAKQAQAKADLRNTKNRPGGTSFSAEADFRAAGAEPQPPLFPLLVCPEPTFEGYCKLTAIGHPALGLFSAEAGSFIGGFGLSQDQRLKTGAGLSSAWDGDPIKRVRAGDGSSVLAGRRLSLHLMAQPDVAALMINDELLRSQGLISRMLVEAPTSTAGTRFFRDPTPAARTGLAHYDRHLALLVRVPLPLRAGTRNELEPRKLSFTPDATRMWIRFHDYVEQHLGDDREFGAIAGLANKAAEHAARLAVAQTLWSDITANHADDVALGNSTLLMRHYLAESLRLRSMAATHGDLRLAQRVLDWIERKWHEPAIYAAAVYNDCTLRDVRDRKAAMRIIKILEEHGWLHRLGDKTHINGAVRREAWLIYGRKLP